ncbi:MAG TPA: LytR C-terminal domain-containing protein [Actinomycetota bacterium]
MNLSPARLAVIVALVVGGVAVLLNGFDGSTEAAAGSGSPTPSTSVSPLPTSPSSPTDDPTTTPAPETDGVTFMVFNGTSTTGLGATVQQDLEAQGYISTEPAGNALTAPVAKTIVYYRGGDDAVQNEANATYMAEEFLEGAAVKLLGVDYENEVPDDTQLVVIVGSDFESA